jgi:transcriptional regulator with XRE-family HTH domain
MKKVTPAKKEVGARFRQFRAAIHKAQHEMAEELRVTQSTIANIEGGKAFPNLTYLHHFYYNYRLDINWLLTGQDGMFTKRDDVPEKYSELLNLLQIPVIEQVINAKLIEAKALLKDTIKTYFEKKEQNETDKKNGTC